MELDTQFDQDSKSSGSLIGIIAIVLILVVGALYILANRRADVTVGPSDEEITSAEQMLQSQSSSDDISSIEADLNNTDFSILEEDLPNDVFSDEDLGAMLGL